MNYEEDDLHDDEDAGMTELEAAIARAEKAEAQADKYKARFRSEKAKQANEKPSDDATINVDEVVTKKIAEQMFFQSNELAKAHETEIREYQTKYNLDSERAFKLFVAETNPEALQKKNDVAIDGHTKLDTKEDWKDMSDDEFFEKHMKHK